MDFVVNDRSSLNNLNCLENYSQGFFDGFVRACDVENDLMVVNLICW